MVRKGSPVRVRTRAWGEPPANREVFLFLGTCPPGRMLRLGHLQDTSVSIGGTPGSLRAWAACGSLGFLRQLASRPEIPPVTCSQRRYGPRSNGAVCEMPHLQPSLRCDEHHITAVNPCVTSRVVQALMFYIAMVLPALYGSLKCGREAVALWKEVLELQDPKATRTARLKARRRKLKSPQRRRGAQLRRGARLDRRRKQAGQRETEAKAPEGTPGTRGQLAESGSLGSWATCAGSCVCRAVEAAHAALPGIR